MDAKEVAELYGRMVGSLGKQEDEFQRGSWKTVLGAYTYADLDAACRRWIADTFIEEWSGKPRGSRMPSAAELKVSIESYYRAASNKFSPCTKCEEGWTRVFTGRSAGSSGYPGTQIDQKVGAVRRCECFMAWMEQGGNRMPEAKK